MFILSSILSCVCAFDFLYVFVVYYLHCSQLYMLYYAMVSHIVLYSSVPSFICTNLRYSL